MSDLQARNVEIMIQESKRMHAEVENLTKMVKAQNDKIHSLAIEMAELKQAQIMATVNAQIALTGHGGTSGDLD